MPAVKMVEKITQAMDTAAENWALGTDNMEWECPNDVLALAVLEELRKPTTRMCKAACKAMSPDRRPTPERVSVKAKHAIRFTAMIDQAIEEASK